MDLSFIIVYIISTEMRPSVTARGKIIEEKCSFYLRLCKEDARVTPKETEVVVSLFYSDIVYSA